MPYSATVRDERFVFPDLRDLLARANEEKSGDQLAGFAARSERERVAAKLALAELTLSEIVACPLVDDDVTALIHESHDRVAFAEIGHLTVGAFREFLLDDATDETAFRRLSRAVTPEIAAATAKLMGNKDLIYAANKVR